MFETTPKLAAKRARENSGSIERLPVALICSKGGKWSVLSVRGRLRTGPL